MGYHIPMMRSEQEVIPYTAGQLEGSPVLVLAPHPDDEVFGCGGALAQAAKDGTQVRIVVLTDGEEQGQTETRRAEARQAAERLGLAEPEFWGIADRSLQPSDSEIAGRLGRLLTEFSPGLLLMPSPAEIHPDHRAVAIMVYGLVQSAAPGSDLYDALQATRLATYEVSAVLRPNLLVDVSAEWETVLSAAEAYVSQLEHHPYVDVMEGMAKARRLTLPKEVLRAEAYFVVDPRYIRTHSTAEWAAAQGPIAGLESTVELDSLDVVVRTRDRGHLLREALASIQNQLHPPRKVIVVNDGGESVEPLCSSLIEGPEIDLVEFDEPRGRSAAAQFGLERATASHVVFLDDDDLMYPDHLLVLGQATARGLTAPYVDAIQGLWRMSGEGDLEPVSRHRTFGGEFDQARFELVNHIPLSCIALPREMAIAAGGFDPELDLYEDWDLLLRLSRKTSLTHVPRVTCEYRMIEGTGAITASNPPGSPGQLSALENIWRRHGLLEDKSQLAAAVMSLVAARDRALERARLSDERLVEARGTVDGLEAELLRVRREGVRLVRRVEEVKEQLVVLEEERDRLATARGEFEVEVARLNGLLETIYRSRTWKLHEFIESLRGRPQSQ